MVNVFQTIVVGADGSPTARQAVLAAADLAQMSKGTLHIVTSHDPEQGPMRSEHGGYVDPALPADQLLESLAGVAKERGLEAALHPSSADPVDALVGVAEEVGADLIVVGNKGMKGVRRVLGSIPNSVAHGAPCSVLIVDTVGAD
jgi:nucleotide-binding universal stress UspA family protein